MLRRKATLRSQSNQHKTINILRTVIHLGGNIMTEHDHEHVHADGTVHSHTHTHADGTEHTHTHTHADGTELTHTHTHADGTELTHTHTHADGTTHTHSHAAASSPEEALALLKYMLDHNRHHAEELHELAHNYDAVEEMNEANDLIEQALTLLKNE